MENSKTILNKATRSFYLSDEQSHHLKKMMLEVMIDTDKICQKYHFDYYLAFGTLLGAVRNKGFIPWDDDVDIAMPFEQIRPFLSAVEKEFGKKYFWAGLSTSENDDPLTEVKLMFSETKLVELLGTNLPISRGIGIDIWPIINIPKSKLTRFFSKLKRNFLVHAISTVGEAKYPPNFLLHNPNRKVRFYYHFRRTIGFALSFRKLKSWEKSFTSFAAKIHRNSDCIALDCVGYDGRFHKSMLDKSTVEFEGYTFFAFKDPNLFLRLEYGPSFLVPPPEEKRERHALAGIDFGIY